LATGKGLIGQEASFFYGNIQQTPKVYHLHVAFEK